jgi:hypothetical protein
MTTANDGRSHGVELTDGMIRLSPLRLDDVDAHLAGEDTELVRWLSGGVSTRQSVQDYIRRSMEQWESGGPGNTASIAVAQRAGYADFRRSKEIDGRQVTWYAKDLSP